MRRDLFEQRLLDRQILRHRFDHPVAVRQQRQIVVEIADGDPRGQRRIVKGRGLGFFESVQRLRGDGAARAVLGRISSSTTGSPALARCAAMREPMVPAPSTAAFRIRMGAASLAKANRPRPASEQIQRS